MYVCMYVCMDVCALGFCRYSRQSTKQADVADIVNFFVVTIMDTCQSMARADRFPISSV